MKKRLYIKKRVFSFGKMFTVFFSSILLMVPILNAWTIWSFVNESVIKESKKEARRSLKEGFWKNNFTTLKRIEVFKE